MTKREDLTGTVYVILSKMKKEQNKTNSWIFSFLFKAPVGHSTVTKWFKKFYFGCKNFDDLARSGRPKSVDFKAELQTIEWVTL